MSHFQHINEYARYGWIMPAQLKKKVASLYPGTLSVLIYSEDAMKVTPLSSGFKGRVRGFLYHHGFTYIEGGDKKILKAQHILSENALKKLEKYVGPSDVQAIVIIYSELAHMMNHDMLHGFNGVAENFTWLDEQLIFGGIEFFPLMSHSAIFERWTKRDANGEFVLNLGRRYITLLKPLADEYARVKDPELLKLLDYFVLIYQKCLLTVLPLGNEIVRKFNGAVNKVLYPDLPPLTVTRQKYEDIMEHGLETWSVKNNITLSRQPGYDRKDTGAAKAGVELLDTYFESETGDTVIRIVDMTIRNLLMAGCFRMVPNMDRPDNLQRQFQKIYMNRR